MCSVKIGCRISAVRQKYLIKTAFSLRIKHRYRTLGSIQIGFVTEFAPGIEKDVSVSACRILLFRDIVLNWSHRTEVERRMVIVSAKRVLRKHELIRYRFLNVIRAFHAREHVTYCTVKHIRKYIVPPVRSISTDGIQHNFPAVGLRIVLLKHFRIIVSVLIGFVYTDKTCTENSGNRIYTLVGRLSVRALADIADCRIESETVEIDVPV